MYSIDQVSYISELHKNTVRYHIKQGFLEIIPNQSPIKISQKNLDDWMRNHLYTDNRYILKMKKLTSAKFNMITEFIDYIKKEDDSTKIIEKFEKQEIKIPSLEAYTIYLRNENIIKDHCTNKKTYSEIMKDYNLSETVVYRILKAHREAQ